MKEYSNNECLCWNCRDKLLQNCIDKSKYVMKIRKQLKKKKLKNYLDRYFLK